jgi:hypothetical protein
MLLLFIMDDDITACTKIILQLQLLLLLLLLLVLLLSTSYNFSFFKHSAAVCKL